MKHQKEYEERMIELRKLIAHCEKNCAKFPAGNLRICKDGKRLKYFHVEKRGDTHGKYIRKKDANLVDLLAKKEYYEKVLREANRELAAIEQFVGRMAGTAPEDVYDNMNEYRRALVSPVALSDKEYEKEWLAVQYEGNPFRPEELIYDTKRGEKVRSKSEAQIADMYYELGIAYRYEYPLKLRNGKVKYPDFALLKRDEKTIVYHEHMGCMEDEDYRRGNLIKLREYAESGIFPGKNLILTFETDYAPLSMKVIRDMVKKLFLE